MVKILDGKKLASQIQERIKKEVSKLDSKPGLAAVIVGSNPESKLYVDMKTKTCEKVGIYSEKHNLKESTSEGELLELIDKLNNDDKIHGILIQFPLPKHINENRVMEAINPKKDVDGFNPINLGRILINQEFLVPATPKGIITLLDHYKITLEGKNIVLINRSKIVGKPLLLMLLNRNATVSVCHSKTKNIQDQIKSADILITGTGKKYLIKKEMVKENSVIIDFGTKKEGKNLYGDVDFENVKDKVSYITPVPGGVGPMTIASLLENCLICYKQ